MICCKCKRPIEKSYGRVTDLGNYCRECAIQNEDEAKKSIVEQASEQYQIVRKETAKEILQAIWEELGIDILSQCYTIPVRTFNKLKRQFGVEVEE